MPRTPHLSKSRFTAGLQCHRQLWWKVHDRDAPELRPDAALQALFDQGTLVGEAARRYVPGGTLIDRPYDDFAGKLAATKRALASDAPAIYEASFSAGNVFVAVDILEREGRGWRVVEVKSSTSVKREHVPDAAIQVHVLRQAGVTVTGADVMVLNRECVHPDLGNLFQRADVTAEVEEMIESVPGLLADQFAVLKGGLPEVAIGDHCTSPHECPFLERCWPPLPEHHVSTLYYLKKRAAEFEASGWRTIHDLPLHVPLNPQADRQRRAVQSGRMVVEGDLAGALERFRRPLAILDFETVAPAVPCWPGCRPYDAVPAQFSCHRENGDGGYEHHEWVAEGAEDPRPELARRVIEACRGAATVVAYNAPFEKSCLERMARALPADAEALRDVIERLADPLPVVREHVYHPDFGGSFSLKTVLPALAPELSYEGLEIAGGTDASIVLARLVLDPASMSPEERGAAREALRRYCARDTLGTARVVERLRELSRSV